MGSAHNAFYRQYEASIGKANIPLASCMFGIGREQTYLSADESAGIVNATPFFDELEQKMLKSSLRISKSSLARMIMLETMLNTDTGVYMCGPTLFERLEMHHPTLLSRH